MSTKEKSVPNLCHEYRINETNLNIRKQFINLSWDDIRVLRRLAPWANRIAGPLAKDFYDVQFAFPQTLSFFESQAHRMHMSLTQLRHHLETVQADYFRQIVQGAVAGGQFGPEYFERRLQVGKLHHTINRPVKWYLGSYTFYQDLVCRCLLRRFVYRPRLMARARRAIFTVFNYDVQAVVDAFFFDYLQTIGLDLTSVQVHSSE